jgi:hypothetical protein
MTIKIKLYWIGRNLLAFILMLIIIPFYMLSGIIRGLYIVFFIHDGSLELAFPWEWEWSWWE